MMGSQTAVTLSVLSQAAWATVAPSSNAETAKARICTTRIVFPQFCRFAELLARPVNERAFDEEKREVHSITHRACNQDRAVHVRQRIQHLRDDDDDERERYGGSQADEDL